MDAHCITCFLILLYCAGFSQADNILLKKPSKQSSTYSIFTANRGNDGTPESSWTTSEENPYWQGDLLGLFTITAITVTSGFAYDWPHYLRNASIGVSLHDTTSCPNEKVTKCGQWPDVSTYSRTQTFTCPGAGPVRYVKVWRDVLDNSLNIGEVEVQGEPATGTGWVYNGLLQQKVTTPITSLMVSSVTECGSTCYRNQPCVAFSYSQSEQPNCLLAADLTMTSDMNWRSYHTKPCHQVTRCGPQV